MDSPGNDLESVAGAGRQRLQPDLLHHRQRLDHQLPVRADAEVRHHHDRGTSCCTPRWTSTPGRYLTGTPMDELTAETFDLTVRVASGEPSAGERAGHSQVSIWRELAAERPARRHLDHHRRPHAARAGDLPAKTATHRSRHSATCCRAPSRARRACWRPTAGRLPKQVGLILPTSLCSGQIALRLAAQAEAESWAAMRSAGWSRCRTPRAAGRSGGASEETFARTMVGYLTPPERPAGAAAGARLREDPQRLLPLPPGRGRRGSGPVRLGQHPGRRRHRRGQRPRSATGSAASASPAPRAGRRWPRRPDGRPRSPRRR